MAGLKAPFPWFGNKKRVAPQVWERFGDVANFVEPFFGSGAVLLGRPGEPGIETVNDLDCNLANFWRACQLAPDAVAEWTDWPVNEADLHARHRWLVGASDKWSAQVTDFRERMMAEPDFYDAKRAGWWLWGICQWIGSGWCKDLHAKMPALKSSLGIHSAPHRQLPSVGGSRSSGSGIHAKSVNIYETMAALSARLRRARVCCGDWKRITGPSVTHYNGLTGVFLDPPYSDTAKRDKDLYAEESLTVAHDVRAWCLETGGNPLMRIALCGYEGEHNELEAKGWTKLAWKAVGGYANQREERAEEENCQRERIWFSPHCLGGRQGSLF